MNTIRALLNLSSLLAAVVLPARGSIEVVELAPALPPAPPAALRAEHAEAPLHPPANGQETEPRSHPGEEAAPPHPSAFAEKGAPWWTVGTPFILRARQNTGMMVIEEYGREDEGAEQWTERLTYQRFSFPRPTASDTFVAFLKEQLATQGTAPRLRLIRQGKDASVFGIHYAATATREEQFSVVLVAVPDPQRPAQVHLVEYLISPTRFAPEAAKAGVKRWQARFLSQASALER